MSGDHAGHIFADIFGGSPELDNLVSQAQRVNQSKYAAIERRWLEAVKDGKVVTASIEIQYVEGSRRPVGFIVRAAVENQGWFKEEILNTND